MPAKKKAAAKVKTARRYTTRTRKPASKAKEAAPAYAAKSGPARVRRAPSAGEALWKQFLALSDDEQGAFIEAMFKKRQWREEIVDCLSVIQARGKPTRPIDEFFAELDRERRK